MKIIVKPTSGICGDGFDVTGLNSDVVIFDYHYHYGYNASWSRDFSSEEKKYVGDILKDICFREKVDPSSIEVIDGYNVFNGAPINGEKFYNDYVKNICES